MIIQKKDTSSKAIQCENCNQWRYRIYEIICRHEEVVLICKSCIVKVFDSSENIIIR